MTAIFQVVWKCVGPIPQEFFFLIRLWFTLNSSFPEALTNCVLVG